MIDITDLTELQCEFHNDVSFKSIELNDIRNHTKFNQTKAQIKKSDRHISKVNKGWWLGKSRSTSVPTVSL